MTTQVSVEQLKTATRQQDIANAFGVYGGQQVDKIAALVFGVLLSAASSAVAAQQYLTFLPDIWRFVVTQAFCFAPYGLLLLGITLPETLQKWLTATYATYLPAYRARLVRHEAAHVLVGHVLGLPLADISVNPAAAAATFYDFRDEQKSVLGLGERVPGPPKYVASTASIETLAVVSLAGIMAEVDEYGDAEGGAADLNQLQAIYDTTKLTRDDQIAITRWAALQAHLILKRNAAPLEALVAALNARSGATTVADCIRALEDCTHGSEDVAALRNRNRVEPGPLERVLVRPPLARDWDAPVGRSSPPQRPFLPLWSEEDVPYLAFFTTMLFVLYAVNGGVKLH